jgi:integrase
VAKRSRGQVSNVQGAARGVFAYALEREYRDDNPMIKLTKAVPALQYNPRERALSGVEIKEVWKAIDEGPGNSETKRALKLVLVTAQRPGEVAGMHMKEIHLGIGKPRCQICRRCGWWTIPKERTKTDNGDHMVYLTPTALALIGEAEGFVFPSPREGQAIDRMALSRHVNRVKYFGLPRWTPHDLRRTARTHMARIGIPREHAEAVLNHKIKGIVAVYDKHDYQEEKKAALISWEKELLRLIDAP